VSAQPFDYQELLQLIELIKSSSHFTEFKLRSGDLEIELRRGVGSDATTAPWGASALTGAHSRSPAEGARAVLEPARAATPSRREPVPGTVVIKAPMVGTMYRAPEPGAAPFVEIGQTVVPGSTLCIIEVMKLMNTISAEHHGQITEILVSDGEAVEFGQDLFVIKAN
jgi:acetyl-CoA carboxylase biotin carboxyl carrier protein